MYSRHGKGWSYVSVAYKTARTVSRCVHSWCGCLRDGRLRTRESLRRHSMSAHRCFMKTRQKYILSTFWFVIRKCSAKVFFLFFFFFSCNFYAGQAQGKLSSTLSARWSARRLDKRCGHRCMAGSTGWEGTAECVMHTALQRCNCTEVPP